MIKSVNIPSVFKEKKVGYLTLGYLNWEKEFPYKPDVKFAVATDGKALYIHFSVKEKESAARAAEDNGRVWEDSCVEFFISFDGKNYYNIECNCIGKLVFGYGEGRNGRLIADEKVLKKIDRWSSIGNECFEEKHLDKWEIALSIPVPTFYKDSIKSLCSGSIKGNVYKCGDNLTTPHYVTLFPISTPGPDYHRPEFFQEIETISI